MADSMQLHQAYWFLKQLHHGRSPLDAYLNFRCIHNCKPFRDSATGKIIQNAKPTFDVFVQIKDFKKIWEEELLQKLLLENSGQLPSNVYYTVNALFGKGHKKEFFHYFYSLYLDLDANSRYTTEQRWAQIQFWIQCGFAPSIVNSSGRGFHVYWFLKNPLTREEGEALLKRMVELSDCKEGGNTWDISRVLRLPGFMNVKKWYDDETQPCAIVYPENWSETATVPDYEAERFQAFPPSSREQIEVYVNKARELCKDPIEFSDRLQGLLKGAEAVLQNAAAQQAGQALMAQAIASTPPAQTAAEFTPKLSVVPHPADIKWPRKLGWAKKYCQLGREGLTQGEVDDIKTKLNTDDGSASNLDFFIIQALVDKGYTKQAVREFWVRTDTKLYRPDKEAKNPNYFDMSYDKALAFAKARHQEHKATSTREDIFVKDHYTMMYKKDTEEVIVTAELKLNAKYVDRDATDPAKREYYDITAITPDPTTSTGLAEYDLFIPRADFNSLDTIKCHSHEMLCFLAPGSQAVQKVLHHMLQRYRNVPTYPFHSKMLYAKGEFVYPSFTVTAEKIIRRDESSPHLDRLLKSIPHYGNIDVKFLPYEMTMQQLRDHWGHTLKSHLPEVVSSVIGLLASAMIAPVFQEKLGVNNFHLPTLNVRGNSNSAKTETVAHLYTITGMRRTGSVLSTASSEFGISKTMSSTNFLTMLIDEFKEENGKDNSMKLQHIRQLVRRIYSGETILKGKSDMSVVSAQNHAPMIILGETAVEHVGDVSEVSRIVPIDTSTYKTTEGYENWVKIQNLQWCELAPLFAQYVLKCDVNTEYQLFSELKSKIAYELSDAFATERYRVAHNIAVLVFGCYLFDKFIKSLDSSLPTLEETCQPLSTMLNYIKNWAKSAGHTLVMRETVEEVMPDATVMKKVVTQVYARNELFDLLQYYGSILESNIEGLSEIAGFGSFLFKINEKQNELYLHFDTFYRIAQEYKIKERQTVYAREKYWSQITAALIKKEPWLISKSKCIRTSANTTKRVIVFNLKRLRQMGVWPDADTVPATKGNMEPQGAENVPQNAIGF